MTHSLLQVKTALFGNIEQKKRWIAAVEGKDDEADRFIVVAVRQTGRPANPF